MSNNNNKGALLSDWKVWSILGVLLVLVVTLAVYVTILLVGDDSSIDPHDHHDHEHDHDHDHDHAHADESDDPQFPPRKLRHAWHEIQANEQVASSGSQSATDDSVHVKLTGEYAQWLIGTPVEISIPQINKSYRSIVDRIVPDGFGNTSIYAKPDSEEEEEFQRLIVTFGASQTFAFVSTSEGSYELQGTDEAGWLTPTSSLRENIDYTKKDVAETRRDRHANTKYVPRREEQE